MHGIFSTLLGPVLVLWIGALAFYILDRFLNPQDGGVAEAIVLALGVGFLLNARPQIDVPLYYGRFLADIRGWGMPPFLLAGRASWLLALVVLGGALAASLTSLGQATVGRAGRLASLGAALLFLFSGDWATLAVAWVLVDVLLPRVLGGCRGHRETWGWTVVLSLSGAMVLGVALLLWQQAEGAAWVDRGGTVPVETMAAIDLPPYVPGLLMLAALLRLMPFPLPTWQADPQGDAEGEERPIAQVVLFVVPTLLGVYLWTRLAQWEVAAQGGRWLVVLSIWGGLALLVSAVKTWEARDPHRLVACTSLYGSAVVLLGAGLDLPAAWQLLIGVNVVLALSVLNVAWTHCQFLRMSDARSYWRVVPAGLGLLSLAGLPLTVGFPSRAAAYHALFDDARWLYLFTAMVSESLFLGALLRVILDVEYVGEERDQETPEEPEDLDSQPLPSRWAWIAQLPIWAWIRRPRLGETASAGSDDARTDAGRQRENLRREIGYAAGAALAVGIIILGFVPPTLYLDSSVSGLGYWFGLPTLPVWAALLLPLVAAVVLYRAQDAVSDLLEGWWPLVQRAFRFDWLYQLVGTILQRLGAFIWGSTQVVEGAGYMAWIVLVCLVILLFVISR